MLKRIRGLLRSQRGGSELITIAIIAALVLLVAFGPGKTLLSKVGTKLTDMGDCIAGIGGTGSGNSLCP